MGEFRMPSLGADMEVGTIVEWRVKPGDEVHKGDIVAVVDTEKSTIEIEVFESGVVEEILVPEGEEVPVGSVLAMIRTAATAVPARKPRARKPRPPARAGVPAAVPAPAVAATAAAAETPSGRVRVSPFARRRAAELGVDVEGIAARQPGAAVTAADIERAAPEPPVRPLAADRTAAMRHAIGALMARSKREIPHYYLATTIDMSATLDWLRDTNAVRPVAERLLPAAALLKATATAAREVPELNGFWLEDRFQPAEAVHVGVAIALRGGGLVAPAIHDADQLPVAELMARLRDLVARARTGVLRGSEMADPTITVTNLGDQGVEAVYGVIYPPQVALVGFGKVMERPWAAGGMLGVRPVVVATLSADHRTSDGHRGALFLAAIDRLLQRPEEL